MRVLRESRDYLKTQHSGLLTTMERKNRLMKGASEEVLNKSGGEVHGHGGRLSRPYAELRKLTVERRKAEREGWRNSHESGVVVDQRTVSEERSFEGETGLAGSAKQVYRSELGVVLNGFA